MDITRLRNITRLHKGQKVRCIFDGTEYGLYIKLGEIYTISSVSHTEIGLVIKLKEITKPHSYIYGEKFELIKGIIYHL